MLMEPGNRCLFGGAFLFCCEENEHMKTFEEYEAEAAWEAHLENALRVARREAAERRRKAIRKALLLWGAVALVLAALWLTRESGKPEAVAPKATAGRLAGDDTPAEVYASLILWQELAPETAPPVQEDYENEKIEAALFDSGYFRADVPLDGDTQSYLRAACEESGVDYELMLAIIRKETGYRNVKGDGGASWGYCQVQPRWHKARMERLGVTDLMDPFGNFRVACDYMAELLRRYDVESALTAYNSGHPGKSGYARTVMGYWEELKNG